MSCEKFDFRFVKPNNHGWCKSRYVRDAPVFWELLITLLRPTHGQPDGPSFPAGWIVRFREFPVKNIYVGNLSFDATEDDVRDAFGSYGEVSSVSVVRDRETGRSRGFGFVEMPNDEEAQKAIEGLNQQDIAGRPVNVNEARPKTDRPRGGGGGRRY